MKLVFCPHCQDVVRLIHERRSCLCGKVTGWYEDDVKAVVYGKDAVVLGVDNYSLVQALQMHRRQREQKMEQDRGPEFTAFIISDKAPSVEWVKRDMELDQESSHG